MSEPKSTPDAPPRVYLNYTQAELDRAYTQSEWAPNSREVIARQGLAGTRLREVMPPLTLAYGAHPDEVLDVFGAGSDCSPVHVHIHGGGWRAQSKEGVSFAAPVFVQNGALFVALNFSLIPQVRLPEMVAQVQRAIGWLYVHAREFGGDPERIHLSGHSAGGHMAGVLMTTDWRARFGLPSDILKSGLLMSGMYDLEPVMLSVRSDYVKLSKDEQEMLSPIAHIDRLTAPIVVAYGDRETPEFKRQAESFVAAVNDAAKPASLLRVGDHNHFEVLDVFANPDSGLASTALRLMGLRPNGTC
jgi:arylformamidase